VRFVSAPARSFRAKGRDPLLDKALHFVLSDRLSVRFGESLPEEVGKFVFGQFAVLICVSGGKQCVKPRVGATHRQPGKSCPARATTPAGSPFTPSVEGQEPSAAKAMLTQPLTGLSVSGKPTVPGKLMPGKAMLTVPVPNKSATGKPVPRKSVMAKVMVASHRVPRETPTVAAFTLPTVMRTSAAMTGPTV
jgi:hypothetical protein